MFKEGRSAEQKTSTTMSTSSFYDVLTRQRTLKGEQSGEKNKRSREDIEREISNNNEETLEPFIKKTEQKDIADPFMDFDDFSR